MTNEIKAEAAKKRGPKPKAKAKRQPMASGSKQLEPREGLDANYHYRWCAGYGKGKIERYIAAHYEFVLDEKGEKTMRPGGDPLFLMRLPKDLWEQDQLAKRGKIIETNQILNQKNQPNKNSPVPEYIPGEGNQVVERDNIS